MAIDQHGTTYHGLVNPRKDLMDRIGVKHAEKMYRDRKGEAKHVGYIVGGLWCEVYAVSEWNGEGE
jgi:hypothetical protein